MGRKKKIIDMEQENTKKCKEAIKLVRPVFSCEEFNSYWWDELTDENKVMMLEAADKILSIKEFRTIMDMVITEIGNQVLADALDWNDFVKGQGQITGITLFFERLVKMDGEYKKLKSHQEQYDKSEVI